MTELLERLGGAPTDRGLIITAAHLGQSHAANVAIAKCLGSGAVTSTEMMVPCAWARDAAARFADMPIGVSLTLNAEFDNYRWGPITQAPSLLDGDGGFPRTSADSWEHSDLEEVQRECRAQIERASQWGCDLTHLSTYTNTLLMRPEFFGAYLDLALEMRLPMRLGSAAEERRAGFPFRRLASEAGVLAPDYCVHITSDTVRKQLEEVLENLDVGVTEIVIAPALDTPELRAMDPGWLYRVEQYLLVGHDHWLPNTIKHTQTQLFSYTDLRDIQRSS
ncbi:MAG: ChbG/HpnK family deacetylase [Acidimicrobiia bacterium]|nr:ChbG/HpnK family deacetylase [Acidimicrobiia bacterium]MYC57064.1 ChbG/HpnK family deacetylase [Acidimicrobiia bacterium]MYG93671.1 ChbG/HpnK family deacetylase [Acidimicrobiia bacterium]MYI30141.1 ChbG/HpnK family deacetylase [Acidimicrobiia bacterium]